MAAGAQAGTWDRPSRRALPRYRVQAPMDVTVLRSGIPDTLPGRSLNVCERGIAAILSGELTPGEPVGLEVRLPFLPNPLRTRALVRHSDRLQCGMEFVGLSGEQQASIRDWAELAKAPTDLEEIRSAKDADAGKTNDASNENPPFTDNSESGPLSRPRRKRRRTLWALLLIAGAAFAATLWWRWNRGWEELESGLLSRAATDGDRRVHVPAELMQTLLIHRIDPEYPPAARSAGLQGVIVLEIVIGTDGSVLEIRPLNGPEVLSHAATEALRWWKFQPYRVNGQAVEVETTVAVEFRGPGTTHR